MYEKRYMKYVSEHSSTENRTGNYGDRAPLNMVQASTRHPFTQKLEKYYIFNCKKMVNLLSKAKGVYRVESLIFASRVGGVC